MQAQGPGRWGRQGGEASAAAAQGGGSSATYISAVNLADSPLDSSHSPFRVEYNLGILGKRCSKGGQRRWQKPEGMKL